MLGMAVARAEWPERVTPSGHWRLTWRDEFDGDMLDLRHWAYDLGSGFSDPVTGEWVPGWGNGELQIYTQQPENIRVQDSVLRIRALRQQSDGRITSARIRTRGDAGQALFAQCYGRFEFRARAEIGRGVWPALWMMPIRPRYGGWAASGEIDVMEALGQNPHEVLQSLHFGAGWPHRESLSHTYRPGAGFDVADWHVYAVEWEPGSIRSYVDEHLSGEFNFWWSSSRRSTNGLRGAAPRGPEDLNAWPAPFDQAFHLLINLAVGGPFAGDPDERSLPSELQVDWVRAYHRLSGYDDLQPRGEGRFPWTP